LCEGSQLPKYRQLAVGLEQLLLSGAIGSGERLPSDRELAEHLGTTTVTVSKGLNELVSRGLLRRKVGSGTYAGDLSEPACRRIGVVCHEVVMPDRAYISPLLHNFHRYWEEKNYQVLTLRGRPENYLQLYQEFRLAGILVLVPREEFFPDIAQLQADGLPLVWIGHHCPKNPNISFGSNHEKTAEEAVKYLHSLGHRRIGFINFTDSDSNRIRKRGYRKGMWNAKLPIHPDWEIGQNRSEFFAQDMDRLFHGASFPTALLLSEIHAVFRLYNVLQQLRLRVPEDISLVAFDDPPYLTEINPPLTVFRQELEEFSGQASRQLELQILGKAMMSINHDNMGSNLMVRKSCRNLVERQETK